MTSEREITPPPGFSAVPTTTTMFAATTPENTPLTYLPIRNNDLRTELEYFSEDYDEEREMKPRPKPVRAVTPSLRAASPRVRRRRERVVGFEETQNRGKAGSKETTKVEGLQKKHQEGIEVKM
ncbi:hypothetical protein Tco_0227932 [Tanacetum coccineum]